MIILTSTKKILKKSIVVTVCLYSGSWYLSLSYYLVYKIQHDFYIIIATAAAYVIYVWLALFVSLASLKEYLGIIFIVLNVGSNCVCHSVGKRTRLAKWREVVVAAACLLCAEDSVTCRETGETIAQV